MYAIVSALVRAVKFVNSFAGHQRQRQRQHHGNSD